MHRSLERGASSAIRWYNEHARPFLNEISPDRIQALDTSLKHLTELLEKTETELPVCFLGNSGVGKSTLLNSLVAGQLSVLPQGGVGPLTAQATTVRYAAEPYFRASYHTGDRLNRLVFALERHHEAELARSQAAPAPHDDEVESQLNEDDRLDAEMTTSDERGDTDDKAIEKIDEYHRQGALLIRGNQFEKLTSTYLADCLRLCLGHHARWGTAPTTEDADRIARVRTALEMAKAGQVVTISAGEDLPRLLTELEIHASGFLAPLIRSLKVGWDTALLKNGLVLVDLPGVGVANDEYRHVTAQWIRRSRAVVLVVNRAGVSEASVDLLRTTGFLNSLLHDSHDQSGPRSILLVAVVQLDGVASDARNSAKQTNPGKKPPPWLHFFDQTCESIVPIVKNQVQTELQKLVDEGSSDTRPERAAAVDYVISTLQVHPVSAIDLRRLLEDDEEEPARIKSEEESRIPQLASAMGELADHHVNASLARARAAIEEVMERATSNIELVLAQWEQEDRAAGEAQRLKEDLSSFVNPLQREFDNRQGAFRNFLRSTIPIEIESRVESASQQARRAIEAYLRKLEGYHWATLRAAVRRGGTFIGAKHIDLPNELTLRFEEPVAVVWSRYILAALREQTRNLGADYVGFVGKLVEWANGQGGRVQPKLVEALHHELKVETRNLGSIGKEAIDELKDHVRGELFEHVEAQVRKRCQKFVRDKRDIGTGVKQRMLEFIREELAEAVVETAKPTAIRVLTTNYQSVEGEINDVFAKYANPLESATDAIVGAYEKHIRRSDAQRRKRVLDEGRAVLKAVPLLDVSTTHPEAQ